MFFILIIKMTLLEFKLVCIYLKFLVVENFGIA